MPFAVSLNIVTQKKVRSVVVAALGAQGSKILIGTTTKISFGQVAECVIANRRSWHGIWFGTTACVVVLVTQYKTAYPVLSTFGFTRPLNFTTHVEPNLFGRNDVRH